MIALSFIVCLGLIILVSVTWGVICSMEKTITKLERDVNILKDEIDTLLYK